MQINRDDRLFDLHRLKTLWNHLTEDPFSFNDIWTDAKENQYKGINDGIHLTIWIRRKTKLPLNKRIDQDGKLELTFSNSKLYSFSKSITSFALVYDDHNDCYIELKDYICDRLDSSFDKSLGNIWISHIGSNAGLRWHTDDDCTLRYLYMIDSNSKDNDLYFKNTIKHINLDQGQSFMFDPSAIEHSVKTTYGPRTVLVVHLQ